MRILIGSLLVVVAITVAGCGGGGTCDSICGGYRRCAGSAGTCPETCAAGLEVASDACLNAAEAWADCFDSNSCDTILTCQDECQAAEAACGVAAECFD